MLNEPEILNLFNEERFEYIMKFGFTKKLVNKFRGIIGGSAFRKIYELD